jgi:phosphoribosyl-dephospho-CoA transferase
VPGPVKAEAHASYMMQMGVGQITFMVEEGNRKVNDDQ